MLPLKNIIKKVEKKKPPKRVTYKMIISYVQEKYGFKVHTAFVAEVKRSLGLPMFNAPNVVDELKHPRKHPTAIQVEAIKDAFEYYEIKDLTL